MKEERNRTFITVDELVKCENPALQNISEFVMICGYTYDANNMSDISKAAVDEMREITGDCNWREPIERELKTIIDVYEKEFLKIAERHDCYTFMIVVK